MVIHHDFLLCSGLLYEQYLYPSLKGEFELRLEKDEEDERIKHLQISQQLSSFNGKFDYYDEVYAVKTFETTYPFEVANIIIQSDQLLSYILSENQVPLLVNDITENQIYNDGILIDKSLINSGNHILLKIPDPPAEITPYEYISKIIQKTYDDGTFVGKHILEYLEKGIKENENEFRKKSHLKLYMIILNLILYNNNMDMKVSLYQAITYMIEGQVWKVSVILNWKKSQYTYIYSSPSLIVTPYQQGDIEEAGKVSEEDVPNEYKYKVFETFINTDKKVPENIKKELIKDQEYKHLKETEDKKAQELLKRWSEVFSPSDSLFSATSSDWRDRVYGDVGTKWMLESNKKLQAYIHRS